LNPNQVLAQPYFGDKKIRFYKTASPVAATPLFTLDLSADLPGDLGPNCVVMHNSKVFIAAANDNGDKGMVLIYNYPDFYPSKVANAAAVLKFGIANGLSSAGMAVNPLNGDLYIPTFHVAGNDGGIYVYSAASNYTTLSHFCDFNDNSVAEICANLAFDGKGNLWMTTWSPDNDSSHHFLICYKGLNKNTFYKITNKASKTYAAKAVSGATITVHLLSAPEGIAFDPSGNLWVANNNDFARTNNEGEGTLVKISSTWINNTLLADAPGIFVVPEAQADIKHIPSGKPGGLLFDGTTLIVNDQGQNPGADFTANGTVWKWNVTNAFNSTNFASSGIHTTYPGNGGASLVRPFFVIADTAADKGTEPDMTTTQPWQSPAITLSGNQPNQTVTVSVKVSNKGMMDSAGTETLKLYWGKASAGLAWPAPWDASVTDPKVGAKMGGPIGTLTLPVIAANGTHTAQFTWASTPDPTQYTIGDGHFCLLARIEESSVSPFGLTFNESSNVVANALNNSRIGWINIHIADPGGMKMVLGGGVNLANHTAARMNAFLAFELLGADGMPMDAGTGSLLLTVNDPAGEKRFHSQRGMESLGAGVFKVLEIGRGIEGLDLAPGEMLNVKAEFAPPQKITGGVLRVSQSERTNGKVTLIGGQTFVSGDVAGFPSARTEHKGCLWLRWSACLAALVAVVEWCRRRRRK
jgi:hypothetical protein